MGGVDWTPEHWSWLEKKFLKLLRETRLVGFEHNHEVKAEGRTYYIDFASPLLALGIEIDSKEFHGSSFAKFRDSERQRTLESEGWTIIRFNSTDILRKPALVKKAMRVAVEKAAQNKLSGLTP